MYGIDVMTPAVMDSPVPSSFTTPSKDWTESFLECLDDLEPFVLVLALPVGLSNPPLLSSRLSVCLSLLNLRPKNDLPAEDCRDLLSECTVDGILNARSIAVNPPHQTGLKYRPFLVDER